ncbi:MAG TPA: alpha/beta fold hydrolase [Cytophagales bacterium]
MMRISLLGKRLAGLLFILTTGAATAQSSLTTPEGSWAGQLQLPGAALRLVLHVKAAAAGAYTATLDSPDQGARGIPATRVIWKNDSLLLEVGSIGGAYAGKLDADSLVLRGQWRQGGQGLPLNLRKTDAAALAPKRDQNPKKPYPYREEEVSYASTAAGVTLAGTLTLPEGKGPFPAVLLITGTGPQNRDEELMGHQPFLVLADYLTRRGIAVLRVDDRGVGKSTGDFGAATSRDFADDALAGVNFLKSRKDIRPRQIGLVGHSEGGLIAPLVSTRSKDIAFMVLMAGPGVAGEAIIQRQTELIMKANGMAPEGIQSSLDLQARLFEILRQEPDAARAEAKMTAAVQQATAAMTDAQKQASGLSGEGPRMLAKRLNTPWFRFFLSYDPKPTLRQVKVPVLAVNGEKDLQVTPRENLAAIAAALKEGGNRQVQTQELPGLNHLFQTAQTGSPAEYAQIEETIAPAALQPVGDWIAGQVGKK